MSFYVQTKHLIYCFRSRLVYWHSTYNQHISQTEKSNSKKNQSTNEDSNITNVKEGIIYNQQKLSV